MQDRLERPCARQTAPGNSSVACGLGAVPLRTAKKYWCVSSPNWRSEGSTYFSAYC